jgi:hypothetical protein
MLRTLLTVAALFWAVIPASAQGSLTFNAQGQLGSHIIIHLEDLGGGVYEGTLTVNEATVAIGLTKSADEVQYRVRTLTGILHKVISAETTVYTGQMLDNRDAEITITHKKQRLIYDGVVEAIDDLTGQSDDDQLVLFWGDTKLSLRAHGDGDCSGLTRMRGQIFWAITCTSAGSLIDAVFLDQDLLVGLILNIFVR